MHFALICRDKPGHLDTRLANREAHLAFARESGVVVLGGPLLDGGAMCGSLVVLEVEDRAAAEAWAAADPYGKAGLFESVEIIEWKRVVG
ncbi:YciI family protein [Phaeovulum vinaykumarii]|uniref:YCII-related domain-containing protein n=1 Tax=Phaeovulum vinaykumarii TaxID=407234 RepID=A0A1N7MA72_9RHOB|nr:YciI family protein [Phaeovulum vinaykumarii]SIS82967.1 hypothetical protein SAMN05421795_106120 [Phaeovulum vinaykumarii]SOC10522.1 hypothetical protein SAMN05878426_10670 [Phaeovulum vinaykumarii]